MRHNSSRRSKNRGHNNGGNQGNNGGRRGNNVPPRMQVFDSNGPDVRIRGTAWQVHEKYLALAKDAASSGDTIMAENYLQHAEHYQRIINTFTEQMGNWAPPASNTDQVIEADATADDNADDVTADAGQAQQPVRAEKRQPRAKRDDDLGLPSSLFKPTGGTPDKVAESA